MLVYRTRQSGLSLVELMVSITLGLLVLAAVVGVFATNSRTFHQNDATEQLQDNARAALDALGRDLSMAGYYGGLFSASAITLTGAASAPKLDCGAVSSNGAPWAFNVSNRVEFFNGTTSSGNAAAAAAQFPCLNAAYLVSNSDIVAIRHVAGRADANFQPANIHANLYPGYIYLSTDGVIGSFFQAPAGTAGTPVSISPSPFQTTSYYRYVPRLYYVRNFTRVVGDGVPALCRAEFCPSGFVLGSDGTVDTSSCSANGSTGSVGFYAQCVATGVDSLQIKWGLDNSVLSGTPSCTVDTYDTNPPTSNLPKVALSAQVSVLLQTTQPDGLYVDSKSFSMADATIGPYRDRFHRRVFSTTVEMRNPVGDSGLCD